MDILGLLLLAVALVVVVVVAVVGASLEVLLAAFYARILGAAVERRAKDKADLVAARWR